MGVILDGGRGLYRGCYWGDQTWFAVLDIDADSNYHNPQELKQLRQRLASVGLSGSVIFQSSDSGGWHVYIPFSELAPSKEVGQALKVWLKSLGYDIKGGQLEVFPSGNGLRLPLQRGFAWLNENAELICSREELTIDAALSRFLVDLKAAANDWDYAKTLIDSQLTAAAAAAAKDAQARQERLKMDGLEHLFSAGRIEEVWDKGCKWWQEGLTSKGERHDAVLAVGHYLWYGDSENGIAALPGARHDEYRARLIEEWLTKKHNGFCRHIDQNKWEEIKAQIKRAALWRGDGQAREYEPYRLTDRLLKRLLAIFRKTGKVWTVEEFKQANDDRKEEARQRIAEAVAIMQQQGRLITIAAVARESGAEWRTVKKHSDLLTRCVGEYNRGGSGGEGAVGSCLSLVSSYESSEERKGDCFDTSNDKQQCNPRDTGKTVDSECSGNLFGAAETDIQKYPDDLDEVLTEHGQETQGSVVAFAIESENLRVESDSSDVCWLPVCSHVLDGSWRRRGTATGRQNSGVLASPLHTQPSTWIKQTGCTCGLNGCPPSFAEPTPGPPHLNPRLIFYKGSGLVLLQEGGRSRAPPR